MKEEKKKWGLGSRGWVLTLYTFLGFATWLAFGNYPINVLNPKYEGMFGWNPTYTSVAYSVATLLVVIFQLLIAKRIAASNVKRSTLIFGSMTLVMGLAIALITNQPLFLLFFILFRIFGDTWALVCNGILVGQWFPTRKGTVMGVATFAFPLGGGFGLALFSALASKGTLIAFMPFLIFGLLAIVLAAAFLSDYPEQVGAFRDNDRTMTPDQAHSIMMKEIEQKQNSCWHGKNLFVCRDFWFLVIPSGLLLFASVGIMIQIISVLVSIDQTFFSKFGPLVLSGISIFACIGSWILGLIDTKFSTKIAIIIAGICMFLAGIAGAVGTIPFVLLASFFLAIFMGASSRLLKNSFSSCDF